MAKRGDRVAPPPRRGEWELRFAHGEAAGGWEELCRQAPGPIREAWEVLSRNPRDRTNPKRMHQLKHDLATREIAGRTLEQWQYEVTGAGRIWYCPQDDRRIVHITHASCGHPKATD